MIRLPQLRLTCFVIVELLSVTTPGRACEVNVTIESTSSIIIELEDLTNAASYKIGIVPRHDISTLGFTLETNETSVQVSYLESDTLYDITVESSDWFTKNCTAHTYPEPIQVIVGRQPTPYSAVLFLGSNPRVTQWEIELNYINGTSARSWNTTANTFFGFIVTDLVPNTDYIVRARASQILGQTVDQTGFGDWTNFTTGLLSVFGRVTLLDVLYETDPSSEVRANITSRIRRASSIKGNFSDLSIIRITDTSGLATVDYEIKVFESFIANIPDFTISSEAFNESRINDGTTNDGILYWGFGDGTKHELGYVYRNLTIACHNSPSALLRTTIEIGYTMESGEHVIVVWSRNPDEAASCGPWELRLDQHDSFATNTITGIGVTALLNDRANDLLYTKLYEAVNIPSRQIVQYYFFNKDIGMSDVPLSLLKYTLQLNYTSAIVFLPKVNKAVKYEVTDISGTQAGTISLNDIDGSSFLQIHLDNLMPNETHEFNLSVTARNQDGGEASTTVPFNISTTLMTCYKTGINEICYKDIDGDSFPDCDFGFTKNKTMICTKRKCSSATCGTNATCSEMDSDQYPGFLCTCDFGFSGNGNECNDTDECDLGTHDCLQKSTCHNTFGSYDCDCDSGFENNGANCEDIDECRLKTYNCPQNSTCHNTFGSYECDCDSGFNKIGTECYYINPCSLLTYNCPQNSTCYSTFSSYECYCDFGFEKNGTKCDVINPCSLGTYNCPQNSSCNSIFGSYECHCDAGFEKNGTICQDINECIMKTYNCTEKSTCRNTIRSYECDCDSGFEKNGTRCLDINECKAGTYECHNNSSCDNTEGSYICICDIGYTGNQTQCSENPFRYKTSLLDSTTLQVATNWISGATVRIDLSNSSSFLSTQACQDIDVDLLLMPISDQSTIFKDLPPGNSYFLEVIRDDTAEVLFEESNSTGEVPPPNPSQMHASNSSIGFRWNKEYTGIAFSIAFTGTEYNISQEYNTTGTSYNATDLDYGRSHQFCIRILYCVAPPGNFTCKTVYTLPSQLNDVQIFVTSTSLTARWSPARGSTKYVALLDLVNSRRKRSVRNFPVREETNGTDYIFDSLEPGTIYRISVAAENNAGTGTFVERTVTTSESEPPYPDPPVWLWIVIGVVSLMLLVIGIAIARYYTKRWYARLDVTEKERLNLSRCFSCWRAVFWIQEPGGEETKRELPTKVENYYATVI